MAQRSLGQRQQGGLVTVLSGFQKPTTHRGPQLAIFLLPRLRMAPFSIYPNPKVLWGFLWFLGSPFLTELWFSDRGGRVCMGWGGLWGAALEALLVRILTSFMSALASRPNKHLCFLPGSKCTHLFRGWQLGEAVLQKGQANFPGEAPLGPLMSSLVV